jgi:three-Cys-motif partner protein
MLDPRTAVSWPLAPHTAAKLGLLGTYLEPWFAILSHGGFPHVIYIDGFAGPGRYSGGEDGSPIVALKALAAHGHKLRSAFEFHFVERDRRTVESLTANIESLREQGLILASTSVTIHARQTFEDAYVNVIAPRLAQLAGAPAFALVDPFGWTGIPMHIMADLMKRPSTELLLNFMFEEINRFLSHKDQPENFDALFGCQDWRNADDLSGHARRNFLHDLYRNQLHSAAGARYVRSFEMLNDRGASDYFLFFATKNLLGLQKMKEAMWRIDPSGGLRFSDATNFNQQVLFEPKPDARLLRRMIEERFSGTRATVRKVELFVLEDTAFHAGHYKTVLRVMEGAGRFAPVNPPLKRRKGTYPDPGLVLDFA